MHRQGRRSESEIDQTLPVPFRSGFSGRRDLSVPLCVLFFSANINILGMTVHIPGTVFRSVENEFKKGKMFFSKIPAYLIDSENVGSTWVSLLNKDERFELFICVTENAKSLNFTLLKELTDEHRYKINIIECKPGKNSLDFYLSSYLGYLIGRGKHSSYTVVSQDTGYDGVIEYWQSVGIDVKRINTKPEKVKKTATPARTRKRPEAKTETKEKNPNSEIRIIRKDESKEQNVPKKRQASPKKKEEKPKNEAGQKLLNELLKEFPENEIKEVQKYLDKVPAEKRSEKNYIYRGLVRKFRSEKGLEIYTLVKKDLDRYYQSSETK